MDRETAYYRRRFNHALEPIKVMLMNKKRTLTFGKWISFVQKTRTRVLSSPVEYLGDQLPSEPLTKEIVEALFRDFLLRHGSGEARNKPERTESKS